MHWDWSQSNGLQSFVRPFIARLIYTKMNNLFLVNQLLKVFQ
jgi:hypothetical protein